jgi:aryl carrier-like protein
MLASLCSGPTPVGERLLAERPALEAWRKRVEAETGGA